jgi:streptogramin lyase
MFVAVSLVAVSTVCLGVAGAAPLGQVVEFAALGTDPAQIQEGVDGNMWFSDRTGSVGQVTPAGVVTRFTAGLLPRSAVRSIAMGPDGNMWFSDPSNTPAPTPAIGMIDPLTQVITVFNLPATSVPLGIAAGPDGNVWFTDNGTTKAIGVIDLATHAITEFPAGQASNLQQGLVAGPDGNLWFTDQGTPSAIGTINPTTHEIVRYTATSGLNPGSKPGASIIVGPDRALWFMDGGSPQAIGRIDPTTHAITEYSAGLNLGAALGRLAAGPDGNVWFGDKGTTHTIGKIDPGTHAITLYSGLNPGSLPGGMGTGSDGNVWFTDQATAAGSTKAVGRIGAGAPDASITPPAVSGLGGANVPKTCGGDTWSSWADRQPSHSAYGFDGYRWRLDGNPIAGASGSSYTPTVADAGHLLSCRVTVTYTLFPVTVSATSTAVHVATAAEQLDDLAAAVVGVGPGKSLAAKVRAIKEGLAADDTAGACDTLGDFLNEVHAQAGKKITAAVAASLTSQAHDIQAALGC